MKSDNLDKMKKYDITCEQVNIYHYKQYQYGKLEDAFYYARVDQAHLELNSALNGKKKTY